MSRDVYQEITDAMLQALDQDIVPWRKPWISNGAQRNLQSGRPYRGINLMLTEMRANAEGWTDPYWTTYKACAKAGGKIVKGSRGQLVTFWRKCETKDRETGELKSFFLLRHYTVFNVAQTEGLEVPEPETFERSEDLEPIEVAESVLYGMDDGPAISHGGDRAFYAPLADAITLPELQDFESAEAYYHTGFHELAHSTGHAKRLNRDGIAAVHSFGDAVYSREELVAELGSCFVSGTVGIDIDLPQSASYINGWRRALSKDKKLIVKAAGQAQKAADLILGVSFAD